MARTKKNDIRETPCCPECGARLDEHDFEWTVDEADLSFSIDGYGNPVNLRVTGWSGDPRTTCPCCSEEMGYHDMVPASRAPDHEAWEESQYA